MKKAPIPSTMEARTALTILVSMFWERYNPALIRFRIEIMRDKYVRFKTTVKVHRTVQSLKNEGGD
ncbi:hypothetical protein HID58_056879 [Brassica napus]|uniref:Uncharacterized protein n=1 Tax=Brassica napus TaxID=3708 RepID=A0ABQ8APG8_BRANA|nr:hypothetical protein HID58_056879 [Brassica napus]